MASPNAIAKALSRAAIAAGAEAHDVLAVQSATTGIGVRGGELEAVDSSSGTDVGLRVFLGQKQAIVSGSDVSDASLDQLAERAVAMAKNAPEDPYACLAKEADLSGQSRDLDLCDAMELNADELKARAQEVESAALSVEGVMQAEGASASQTRSSFSLITSDGFEGGWESSRHTIGVSAFAETGGQMERDYDHHGQRFLEDLPSPESVGRTAGERTVKRLGAQKMRSGTLPVIFDRRVADNVLGAFLSAIAGTNIARGNSFLKTHMGERLFPEGFTITDDPLRKRGLGSRPFDAEGVACEPLNLIEDGVLQHWLLNTASAKKLGLTTTARAQRSVGSPPGVAPTNSWIAAGAANPEVLIADVKDGLLVSEMFGPSLNLNTGDYSVGVAGFAISSGAVSHPVSEVTIAGNLLEMFSGLRAANDLIFDGSVVSPTLRVPEMTVAGE